MKYVLAEQTDDNSMKFVGFNRRKLMITEDWKNVMVFNSKNAVHNFLKNLPSLFQNNKFKMFSVDENRKLIIENDNYPDVILNIKNKINYDFSSEMLEPHTVKSSKSNVATEEIIGFENLFNDIKKELDTYSMIASDIETKLNDYYEKLSSNLSYCDKIITDIEHFCEKNNLNASQGYKLNKLLHDVLNERRDVKNARLILQSFKSILKGNKKNYDISKRMDSLREDRTYTPRVLRTLFEEGKKCL